MNTATDDRWQNAAAGVARGLRKLFAHASSTETLSLRSGTLAMSGLPRAELNRGWIETHCTPEDIDRFLGRLRARRLAAYLVTTGVNSRVGKKLEAAGGSPAGELVFSVLSLSDLARHETSHPPEADVMPTFAAELISSAFGLPRSDCRKAWPERAPYGDDMEFLALRHQGTVVTGGWFVRVFGQVSIFFLGTREACRGKGFAAALLAAAATRYRARGVREFVLAARPEASPFYEKLGFRVIGRRQVYRYDAAPAAGGNSGTI